MITRAFTAVAAITTALLLSIATGKAEAAFTVEQSSGTATVSTQAPLQAAAGGTCEALLEGAAKLPTGLTADKACSILDSAVQLAKSNTGSASKKIQYSAEEEGFYKALGKSLRKYAGKEKVTVSIAGAGAPVITIDSLRFASAPTYQEIGLGVWFDRIEDSGGKLCVKDSNQALGVAGVVAIIDFFFKKAVPFLIQKYNAANAYRPARRIDAIVYKTATGPEAGRITQIVFVPRGTASGCQASNI